MLMAYVGTWLAEPFESFEPTERQNPQREVPNHLKAKYPEWTELIVRMATDAADSLAFSGLQKSSILRRSFTLRKTIVWWQRQAGKYRSQLRRWPANFSFAVPVRRADRRCCGRGCPGWSASLRRVRRCGRRAE